MFTRSTLFHLHTDFTDGRLRPSDYFEFAASHGITRLVFLEHIRKQPAYDPFAFAATIQELSQKTGVPATVGFESKLLPDGTLDISETHLAIAEIIGIAEHSFPNHVGLLADAFIRAVDHYRSEHPPITLVWVHPGLSFVKRRLDVAENSVYWKMMNHAQSAGVHIERNLRYNLVSEGSTARIRRDLLVVGLDCHTHADLESWRARAQLETANASGTMDLERG